MKIINYKYGYIDTFSCSIHGKIVMTRAEWKKASKYLFNGGVLKKIQRRMQQFPIWELSGIIQKDIDRRIETKQGTLINIRVSPTEILVERFKPKGTFKRANYMLLILRK